MAIGPFDKLGQYTPEPLDFNLLAKLGEVGQRKQEKADELMTQLAGYYPSVIAGTGDAKGAEAKMQGYKQQIADLAQKSAAGKISNRELMRTANAMKYQFTSDPQIQLWKQNKEVYDKVAPDVKARLIASGKYHPAFDPEKNPSLFSNWTSENGSIEDILPKATPDFDAFSAGAWKPLNERASYVRNGIRYTGVDPNLIKPYAKQLASGYLNSPEADAIFQMEQYNARQQGIELQPEDKFEVLSNFFERTGRPAQGGVVDESNFAGGTKGKKSSESDGGIKILNVGSQSVQPAALNSSVSGAPTRTSWDNETNLLETAATTATPDLARQAADASGLAADLVDQIKFTKTPEGTIEISNKADILSNNPDAADELATIEQRQNAIQSTVNQRRQMKDKWRDEAAGIAITSVPEGERELVNQLFERKPKAEAFKKMMDESLADVLYNPKITFNKFGITPLMAEAEVSAALRQDNPYLHRLLTSAYNGNTAVPVSKDMVSGITFNIPQKDFDRILKQELSNYKQDVQANPTSHAAIMTKLPPSVKQAAEIYNKTMDDKFNEYFNQTQINTPIQHIYSDGKRIPIEQEFQQMINPSENRTGLLGNMQGWNLIKLPSQGEKTDEVLPDQTDKGAGIINMLGEKDKNGKPVQPAEYNGLTWLDLPGTFDNGLDKRGYYITMTVGSGEDRRQVLATYPGLTNQILGDTVLDYDSSFANNLAFAFPSEAVSSGKMANVLPGVPDLQISKQRGRYVGSFTSPLPTDKGKVDFQAADYPKLVAYLNEYYNKIRVVNDYKNLMESPSPTVGE